MVIDGEEVADPYFDYNTNLLTYVFNEKSKGGTATASINLRGIIPDKYYAKETGEYPFTIKVAPGAVSYTHLTNKGKIKFSITDVINPITTSHLLSNRQNYYIIVRFYFWNYKLKS